MRQRRQLEYPKSNGFLLTEQMICFVFVRFALLFFFLVSLFAVAAQLRREMTKFVVYLASTTGKARRKNVTVFNSDAVPFLQLPADFP